MKYQLPLCRGKKAPTIQWLFRGGGTGPSTLPCAPHATSRRSIESQGLGGHPLCLSSCGSCRCCFTLGPLVVNGLQPCSCGAVYCARLSPLGSDVTPFGPSGEGGGGGQASYAPTGPQPKATAAAPQMPSVRLVEDVVPDTDLWRETSGQHATGGGGGGLRIAAVTDGRRRCRDPSSSAESRGGRPAGGPRAPRSRSPPARRPRVFVWRARAQSVMGNGAGSCHGRGQAGVKSGGRGEEDPVSARRTGLGPWSVTGNPPPSGGPQSHAFHVAPAGLRWGMCVRAGQDSRLQSCTTCACACARAWVCAHACMGARARVCDDWHTVRPQYAFPRYNRWAGSALNSVAIRPARVWVCGGGGGAGHVEAYPCVVVRVVGFAFCTCDGQTFNAPSASA